MAEEVRRPAFYATAGSGWRDWWTVLHPPYTAWHLSYVVLGGCLAPRVQVGRLLATLLAFFLAVGLGAHALDELNGRPLGTHIAGPVLLGVAIVGLVGAVVLGAMGVSRIGWGLLPFIVVGAVLVLGYNLELAGGLIHTDMGFAASWGAFPVLTAYFAQAGDLNLAAVAGAGAALALSWTQRRLSTPARELRRQVRAVEGTVTLGDGSVQPLNRDRLLRPLEDALKALSWATVALAIGLALARLGP